MLLAVIAALLAVWLVCIVIGFVFKALLWLAVLGLVLFVVTGIYGAVRCAVGRPEE
jgi:uncharacterized membrane protein YeiH